MVHTDTRRRGDLHSRYRDKTVPPLPPRPSTPMSKSSFILAGLILTWLLALVLGFLALGRHDTTPGARGSPPDRWPSGASVQLDQSRPTLLIFIHPRCPCSAASMDELAEAVTRLRGRFAAHVLAFRPEGWEESALGGFDGLSIQGDPGGREAARFGVETSGHVLVFDPSGRRVFSGGITISRGHRGDNPGLDRLIGAIEGASGGSGSGSGSGSSPVYGCPVFAPGEDRSGRVNP
jgi:hypothetical protein